MKYKKRIVSCIVALVILLIGYFSQKIQVKEKIGLENIPEFSGSPYVELNGNKPYFTDEE